MCLLFPIELMDFEPFSIIVCFPAGEFDMTVPVATMADDILEADSGEMFLVRLGHLPTNTVPVNITQGATAVLIVDAPCMFVCCIPLKPCLHWSSNLDLIHFRSQSEFQSTNGCGLSQSVLNLDWWGFTLESNSGECGFKIRTPVLTGPMSS